MVCGLFSVFDPVCFSPIFSPVSLKWVICLPVGLGLFWQFGPLSSGVELLKKNLCMFIVDYLKSYTTVLKSSVVFSSLFFLLIVVNFSGLSPLCYALSSHPGIVLPVSLSLFFAWAYKSISKEGFLFMSHFLPSGSPLPLWGFLVFVETISMFIRPFTLAIRLVANVMAGHLFVEMLAQMSSMVYLYPVMSGLLSFEIAVGLVQAFVFTNLMILYWSE